MKKRIKSDHCFNCGHHLTEADNFCPACGQENDNKRQSFGVIMADMITSFLSLESKFANSLPAILFKPGHLTREFIEGKRQRYLAPARMYITIVVVYFLISSIGSTKTVINEYGSDSTSVNTTQTILQEGPLSFRITGDPDSVEKALNDTSITENLLNSDRSKYAHIRSLVKGGITETEQLLDTIHVENTLWNRFYYSQVIKLASTEYEDLKDYFADKLPWIFFLLVPVFALLLKLMYIRKKFLYIDHLIFAFHLHTFYFIIAVISSLAFLIFNLDIGVIAMLLSLVYTTIAFKKFYLQGYFMTFLKMILTFTLYIVAALFSVINILFVMFILY